MAFTTKNWTNRISEFPNRRTLTKSNGSNEVVEVARNEGAITQAGTPLNAENMNDLEQRISAMNSSLETSITNAETAANNAVKNNLVQGSNVLLTPIPNTNQVRIDASVDLSLVLGDLATIEQTPNASKDYIKGDYLVFGGLFYKVLATITRGDALVVNTQQTAGNIEQTTVGDELYSLNTDFATWDDVPVTATTGVTINIAVAKKNKYGFFVNVNINLTSAKPNNDAIVMFSGLTGLTAVSVVAMGGDAANRQTKSVFVTNGGIYANGDIGTINYLTIYAYVPFIN